MDASFGIGLLVLVVALTATLATVMVRFCVADAKLRGKSPLLVSLAAVLFFPWGLLAWLVFRPEPPEQFQLDDYRLQ